MNRTQREPIIPAGSQIPGDAEIVVIDSQAIHAKPMKLLPITFQSEEADVSPRNHPERAEEIDTATGDLSRFQITAILPHGWEQSVVRLSNVNTGGANGLCVDVHDLAMSKYVTEREKDIESSHELARHGVLHKRKLIRLVPSMPVDEERKRFILARIKVDFAAATSGSDPEPSHA